MFSRKAQLLSTASKRARKNRNHKLTRGKIKKKKLCSYDSRKPMSLYVFIRLVAKQRQKETRI